MGIFHISTVGKNGLLNNYVMYSIWICIYVYVCPVMNPIQNVSELSPMSVEEGSSPL